MFYLYAYGAQHRDAFVFICVHSRSFADIAFIFTNDRLCLLPGRSNRQFKLKLVAQSPYKVLIYTC